MDNAFYKFTTIQRFISQSPDKPSPIKTAVDIGCRHGSVAEKILKFFPEAHVHAYDILPLLLTLTQNRNKQFSERFETILSAVTSQHLYSDNLGKEPMVYKLFLNESDPRKPTGASIVSRHPMKDKKYKTQNLDIPKTTLSDVIDRIGGHVDYIKMDCEGCEHSTLGCASTETLEKTRFIVGEYHNLKKFKQVVYEKLLLTHRVHFIPVQGQFGSFFAEKTSSGDSLLLSEIHPRRKCNKFNLKYVVENRKWHL